MDPVAEGTYRKLDARLDDLTERLSHLEGKAAKSEKRSVRKLVSDFGGLIALFISIVLGGYTLHDNIVVKPMKANEEAFDALRGKLDRLSNLSARLALAMQTNPQTGMTEMRQITPQRLSLINEIDKTPEEFLADLTVADHLLLSQEFGSFRKIEKATKYAERALVLADDELQKSAAYSNRAHLRAAAGDAAGMRADFAQAITELRRAGEFESAWDILSIYGAWVGYEISITNCAEAQKVSREMADFYRQWAQHPQLRAQVFTNFDTMLRGFNQTCGINAGILTNP